MFDDACPRHHAKSQTLCVPIVAEALVPAEIQTILEGSGLPFEVVPCDPEDAETAVFAKKYGYAMEDSANCILTKTKTGEEKFAASVVLIL